MKHGKGEATWKPATARHGLSLAVRQVKQVRIADS